MPLQPGSSKAAISANISELTHHGSRPRSHEQIVAIALANARRHPRESGGASGNQGEPRNPYNRLLNALDPKRREPAGGSTSVDDKRRSDESSKPSPLPWPLQGRAEGGLADTHFAPLHMLPDPNRSPAYSGSASERAYRLARAGGGGTGGLSYAARQAARSLDDKPYGLALGTGGGRTDKNDISVGAGSYVLPADVVSGLGDGNTLGGAKIFDMAMQTMPWGISAPKSAGRRGPPAPPHDASMSTTSSWKPPQFADGGADEETPGVGDDGAPPVDDEDESAVPIQAADGEITMSPEDVLRIGQFYAPDSERDDVAAMMRRGHKILDLSTKMLRGKTIRHLKSLRGPVGSKEPDKGYI